MTLPPPSQYPAPAGRGSRIGVRAFLFIVLSLCTVVPICVLGFSQAHRWARTELAAADRQAFAAAQSAANQLTVAMLGYVHATESLAAQVAARKNLEISTLQAVMDAHRAPHQEFLGVYVADKNGHAILNEGANGEFVESHINYGDRDYFAELLRTKHTVVSKAAIGRVTRLLSVQIVAPIFDKQGTFVGFTCSSVNLEKLASQLKQSARGMSNGRIVVIDAAGQLIADSDQQSGTKHRTETGLGIFAAAALNGELREGTDELHRKVRGVAVGLPDPVIGWRAIAIIPKTAIDANARRLMLETATLALTLAIVMLALAAWLAAWIARPLRALAATTRAVSQGELSLQPGVLRGLPQEMAQLTLAVRGMIEKLRRHTEELESEVAARTESLSRSNLELTHAIATIRRNEERIREDIEKAHLFQEKMLPTVPVRSDLDIAARYRPLQQVSGDIFDIAEIAPNQLRLLVADATGHGVQASMRTISLKSAYDRLKHLYTTPGDALQALNESLVHQFPDGDLHCAASCVDLHVLPTGVELVYANAGNTPLFVLSPGQPAVEIYDAGPLLGIDFANITSLPPLKLRPGQLVLMASDGLIEQSNPQRNRFEARLRRVMVDSSDTANDFCDRLLDEFERFRHDQSIGDDITFIAVRITLKSQ